MGKIDNHASGCLSPGIPQLRCLAELMENAHSIAAKPYEYWRWYVFLSWLQGHPIYQPRLLIVLGVLRGSMLGLTCVCFGAKALHAHLIRGNMSPRSTVTSRREHFTLCFWPWMAEVRHATGNRGDGLNKVALQPFHTAVMYMACPSNMLPQWETNC